MWTHELLRAAPRPGRGQLMQEKFDGFRVCFFKDDGVCAFGRDQRPHLEMISRFPRLLDLEIVQRFLKDAPRWSSLDCEVVTDGHAASVSTALRDETMPLCLKPFAVPYWGGKNMAMAHLGHVAEKWSMYDIAPVMPRVNSPVELAKWKGIEGYVLKERNYYGWSKAKVTFTIDAIVVDTVEGKGKYEGMLGSLVVAVWKDDELVPIANVSGMTDAERWDMTMESPIGKVVEIECQGAVKRLRHPRFVRFRPDKPSGECTYGSYR